MFEGQLGGHCGGTRDQKSNQDAVEEVRDEGITKAFRGQSEDVRGH